MSFAEAFEEVFKKIMGRNWKKPHIKKVGRRWECTTSDSRRGVGVNPKMAYGGWEAMRDEPRRHGTNPPPPGGYQPRQHCGPVTPPPRNP